MISQFKSKFFQVVCCAVATSIIWVVIIYQTRKRMSSNASVIAEPTAVDFTDKVIHFADNASENSSCKDSGTGDSAKRSNEDLLPEEYTLIINGKAFGSDNLTWNFVAFPENNTEETPSTTMRMASLVYVIPDGNSSHTPLLHTNEETYSRSTNHDRSEETEMKMIDKAGADSSND